MAESPAPATIDVPVKSVQELVLDPENNFPDNYIHKDAGAGFQDALLPTQEIPVIDLGLIMSAATAEQELTNLHSALSTWGCFQIINHGMTRSFLDEVRQVSKQFFELPKEEKQKFAREPNDIEGYGNDMILSKNQTLDWSDRIVLKVQPEDQRKFKVWPEKPKDFKNVLAEYSERIKLLTKEILKAMAKSLNLEEECFLRQCEERAQVFVRFNYYPPCPRPDLVLGLKPHADGSLITFLLQDKEVEGLQLLRDNQWFKVPIISEALLVNAGDVLEILSNGIFKSPMHRAVINSEKERLTVVMFVVADPEKVIEPVEELVNESRPRLYKSVKNYAKIHIQYYQQGKRAIEGAKIQP
ncbi:hypothetical protein L6164_014351 [Bauhinia variegata]|uniref:Uncharacterized protein n=1 Tax=Bauhinia variegata TaxID=167791 RepID=A0ACB9NHT1_BAUVA|nr:hypothetical protein L6164_014351 [Bauhinia variegata]